jgi:hypothetical protein
LTAGADEAILYNFFAISAFVFPYKRKKAAPLPNGVCAAHNELFLFGSLSLEKGIPIP